MRGPSVLENAHVRLEPLGKEHITALTAAATEDRSTYAIAPVPRDRDEMEQYVVAATSDSHVYPFATFDKLTGKIVGSVRLMNLEWWSWPIGPIEVEDEPRVRTNGDPPDACEIGAAWLAKSAQRTHVNTSACLLLMGHAFDLWRVHRLVLKTDVRNERSRNAITRLGAKFEGELRQHLPAADGIVRDTAMFSIIRAEWPDVRARLEKLVAA